MDKLQWTQLYLGKRSQHTEYCSKYYSFVINDDGETLLLYDVFNTCTICCVPVKEIKIVKCLVELRMLSLATAVAT